MFPHKYRYRTIILSHALNLLKPNLGTHMFFLLKDGCKVFVMCLQKSCERRATSREWVEGVGEGREGGGSSVGSHLIPWPSRFQRDRLSPKGEGEIRCKLVTCNL